MAFDGKYSDGPPMIQAGFGIQTPYALVLPPGGRIAAFVRSTGQQNLDDPVIANDLVPTLAQGLARCRAGMNDTVVCLPGHSESVTDSTMLANMVAGTRVIGVGRGGNAPVFRWTNTAGSWLVDDADCVFQGLRLRMEGANGVVKAINVTAADCGIYGCDVETSSGAALKAAIGIEVGAGAHRFELCNNRFRSSTDIVTDPVKVVAAVNNVHITDNVMCCAATAGTGIIHATAAVVDIMILRNYLCAIGAASVAAIGVDNVAATGQIAYNTISVLNTGAHVSATTGIFMGANVLIRCGQNFSANDPRVSGLLMPSVDT